MWWPRSNEELVRLVREDSFASQAGSPPDERVLAAMLAVDRASFLPPELAAEAYHDEALPIGGGQTCSQPSVIALMLGLLRPFPGARVLEVGSGSGYVAALLAYLVGTEGEVLATEILPELALRGGANCAAAGGRRGAPDLASRISFLARDGSDGLPEEPPFDRILLSAGVRRKAEGGSFSEGLLVERLKPGGILVYPERRGRIFRISLHDGGMKRESWGEVAFVPLRGRNS